MIDHAGNDRRRGNKEGNGWPISYPRLREKFPAVRKPITIGEDAWIGAGVIILPGVSVGRGSLLGAGSIVTKDVPEYTVVAGNPARVLRTLSP